jgi:uncharacterized integral membrane protein
MADAPDDPSVEGWSNFRDGKVHGGEDEATTTRGRDWGPRVILAAVALLAAVLFILQNGNSVRFEFLLFSFRARLWVLIVVCVLLGAFLGQALGLLRRRTRKSDD